MVFYMYHIRNGGSHVGKELEYKLFVPDEAALLRILRDGGIAALAAEVWQETKMKTTYFDSADRRFSSRHWTLRHRQEGEKSIVCVKTPQKESHTRGEWQIEAPCIDESAVERLLEAGAPKELLYLYGAGDIVPICGAEFLRRHVMLTFPDGSQAELAGDCGTLHGQKEQLSFCEIELEHYDGSTEEMLQLVKTLCEIYDLHEQPLSKFARARVLK